jgi:hypothetical protein
LLCDACGVVEDLLPELTAPEDFLLVSEGVDCLTVPLLVPRLSVLVVTGFRVVPVEEVLLSGVVVTASREDFEPVAALLADDPPAVLPDDPAFRSGFVL